MSQRNSSSLNAQEKFTDSEKNYYTIGDLAREFGVTLRTLRFYEDRGLLSPLREGMLRLYDGRDRTRLQIILKGKQLGFTLSEIRDMVGSSVYVEDAPPKLELTQEQIETQISYLDNQRVEIEAALAELRAQKTTG
jgi:DNA-binding transcriptional MerR regulator